MLDNFAHNINKHFGIDGIAGMNGFVCDKSFGYNLVCHNDFIFAFCNIKPFE